MRRTSLFSPTLAAGLALSTALAAGHAHAYPDGRAVDGCTNCHRGGKAPTVTLDVNPRNPATGQAVAVRVTIQAVNGDVGGLSLRVDGDGRLQAVNGQGTRLLDDRNLVHSAPKRASGGAVVFDATWVAPETPGGVILQAWGLSANGDRGSYGDGAAMTQVALAYGCPGTTYYRDLDGDGYGSSEHTWLDCSQPDGYAAQGGDCDDFSATTHPGARELCNGRDDDCDGEIDEDLEVTLHFVDADGDGHGAFSGPTVMAKCPPEGYAPTSDDCDDGDPLVHVGAIETCNYIDDNCDGRVDEGVREICGVGMCAREAFTCTEPILCTPAEPTEEVCNGVDDDCDGMIDEGDDLCGPGEICALGRCVAGGDVSSAGSSGAGGPGAGASIAAGSGAGGSGSAPSGVGAGGTPEPGGEGSGGCALDPRRPSPSPWPLLLAPLALAALRSVRRALRR